MLTCWACCVCSLSSLAAVSEVTSVFASLSLTVSPLAGDGRFLGTNSENEDDDDDVVVVASATAMPKEKETATAVTTHIEGPRLWIQHSDVNLFTRLFAYVRTFYNRELWAYFVKWRKGVQRANVVSLSDMSTTHREALCDSEVPDLHLCKTNPSTTATVLLLQLQTKQFTRMKNAVKQSEAHGKDYFTHAQCIKDS